MKSRPSSSSPKFYTIEQIADCVEASTRSVRRWIDEGLLVAHRINGLVRVSDQDFQAFLANHRGLLNGVRRCQTESGRQVRRAKKKPRQSPDEFNVL